MAERKASPAPSPPPSEVRGEKDGWKRNRSISLFGSVAVVVIIVLGLALGLGLGLGLKKHSDKPPTQPQGVAANSSTPNPPNSYASQYLTSLRLDTRDYNLDMTDWDIAAPPTTRTYNFTLSEFDAAPDGRMGHLAFYAGC
jgi:hypothetical protein